MKNTIDDILNRTQELDSSFASFIPEVPKSIEETGLNEIFLEDLICKIILAHGSLTGGQIAHNIGLPLRVIESMLHDLKQRLILAYQATAGLNDFEYVLTGAGRQKALLAKEQSNYQGTAPVPFSAYLESVEKQSIRNEHPDRYSLEKAFDDLVLEEDFFSLIGPAVNSGRGIFIYGDPGNGKTEVATKISKCFTESIYLPKTIIAEGHLIQLYDPQCHSLVKNSGELKKQTDQRWLRIERPAVIVGGEMDLKSLELGYNSQTKICEASLQLKANCGILIIDDFGRQIVTPEQLLNRWILPLEKKIDYLTLPSGTKVQVPFNELLVFCSNIDPGKVLNEAFLRRIPYKIQMVDPNEPTFIKIFKETAKRMDIDFIPESIEHLLKTYYRGKHNMRNCHPRDILQQLQNIAIYEQKPAIMSKEKIDMALKLYFAATSRIN